jgi:alkylation response protein AidB-like acyl-CoA dehydrogenase
MIHRFGSAAQKAELLEDMITGRQRVAFGLTEPDHGSDATWLETRAVRDGGDWVIDGESVSIAPAQCNAGPHLRVRKAR